MNNEVLTNIKTRRSVRSYKHELIKREELDAIIEAGTYAPTGSNKQSYLITAVYNMEKVSKINEAIVNAFKHVEVNDSMNDMFKMLIKRANEENASFVYNAPALIFVSNIKDLDNCMADSTCVMENMMLAAHSLGIGTCWLNLFTRAGLNPAFRQIYDSLGIPENHVICGTLSIGYPDDKLKEAPLRKEGTVKVIM
jgi:nitroreductase